MRSAIPTDTISAAARSFNNARSIHNAFAHMGAAPICGKPRRGFKACRKYNKLAQQWAHVIERERALINDWITRGGKASKLERERRTARVIELIPDWSNEQ